MENIVMENKLTKIRRSYRHLLIALFTFVVLLSLSLFVVNSTRTYWAEEINEHTREHALNQSTLLQRNLNRSFGAAYLLGTLVQQNNGHLDNFDAIAKSILHSSSAISNVQLAPNGVIEKIYPLAGQEKAIGHNIFGDDVRKKEAFLAADTRAITLAGPFELKQGGVAIIARQPVFLSYDGRALNSPGEGDYFWGFTSVLIYLSDALEMMELKHLERSGFDYQLSRINPDTGQEVTFAGSVEQLSKNRYRSTIHLPNSTWFLDVARAGISFSSHWVEAIAFLCIVISMTASHWLYTVLSRGYELRGLVNKRTQQLKLSNQKLQRETLELQKLSNAVEQSGNAVVITDVNGIIEYINPRFTTVTGYLPSEAIGKKTSILRSPATTNEEHTELWQSILSGNSWYGERRNQQKNGHFYWSKMSISPVKNSAGVITHFVCVSEDITDEKEEYLNIQHLAFHDSLTGLPNRRFFVDRLEQSTKMTKRNKKNTALMFIDLDKFKNINDTLGHDVGDKLLVEISHRLKGCIRETDTLSRLGGDEFTLLLAEIGSKKDAEDIAKKMLAAIAEKMNINGNVFTTTISIGFTLISPCEDLSATQLIRRADIALYQAKERGRNTYCCFNESLELSKECSAN